MTVPERVKLICYCSCFTLIALCFFSVAWFIRTTTLLNSGSPSIDWKEGNCYVYGSSYVDTNNERRVIYDVQLTKKTGELINEGVIAVPGPMGFLGLEPNALYFNFDNSNVRLESYVTGMSYPCRYNPEGQLAYPGIMIDWHSTEFIYFDVQEDSLSHVRDMFNVFVAFSILSLVLLLFLMFLLFGGRIFGEKATGAAWKCLFEVVTGEEDDSHEKLREQVQIHPTTLSEKAKTYTSV
eukprot:TRINITY_DN9899_c0_g1_i1.p1 TRINITY_DN9899_c0_g1~~TRINITY_DN9899_c0_g1_i1.p1  ORF type:complete len:247 (+),score=21.45 TRINITY_DN9899_c0_g1_i1:29-742(+)